MDRDVVKKSVSRVTLWGMIINIVIAVLKGVGGIIWSSQALIADAVHSVSDLITDIAVLIGVRYWSAPADEEHPYGHGKIEALISLMIAGALFVVALELGIDAVKSLIRHESRQVSVLAMSIALISIVLKEILFRWTRKVAREVHSTALEANAWHHRSDALSSIPVAIALAVAWFWPTLGWVDGLGAAIVAVFIVAVSWEIAKPSLQELIDAGIDSKSAEVKKIAEAIKGVQEVHCCRARRYGGAFQADLHIQVDASLSIAAAHALGHEVKDAIVNAEIDVTDAVIHVEPRDLRIIVSLGSNIEPREEYLKRAIDELSALPATHFIKASSVIETTPIDVPPEFAEMRFLNQAAIFETALSPHDFSRRMHEIEDRLGRIRTVRNGPRTIDIDLIDFGGIKLDDPELTLPHPRARQRSFVTEPLAELGVTFL